MNSQIANFTFAEIYELVKTHSIARLVQKLNTSETTIKSNIARLKYGDQPLTIALLKSTPPEKIKQFFSDVYNTLVKDWPRNSIRELTLAAIHNAALNNVTAYKAASHLNIDRSTLIRHLDRFWFGHLPMSFKLLNNITPQQLRQIYQEDYDKPLTETILTRQTSLQCIHNIILESPTIIDAAKHLKIDSKTFATHLRRCQYQGQALSFDLLKRIHRETLHQEYGKNYTEPFILLVSSINNHLDDGKSMAENNLDREDLVETGSKRKRDESAYPRHERYDYSPQPSVASSPFGLFHLAKNTTPDSAAAISLYNESSGLNVAPQSETVETRSIFEPCTTSFLEAIVNELHQQPCISKEDTINDEDLFLACSPKI